jgi:hypothetical protein
MKYRWFVPSLLLLTAVMACGPSQNVIQTAIAQTQVIQATMTSRAAQTVTAAAPTPTSTWTDAPPPTDTPPPSDTPQPTDTPAPTRTPKPTNTAAAQSSARATPTRTPLALLGASSPTPTRRPVAAGPSFLDTVVGVKKQVDNFGWQIDIAVNSGSIDCQQTVNSYEYVAARAILKNVPASLTGAYSLYTQGVSIFIPKAADLYQNCKNFLANPSGATIPALQWTVARTAVSDASQLLRQAIIAAGGTP